MAEAQDTASILYPAQPAEEGEQEEQEAGGEEEQQEEQQNTGEESPEAEPSEENQTDDDLEEEEAETITSFSQLVEHQEWDPEWAKTLTATTVVDGETKEVPITDLVASYQTLDAAEKRLDDAKSKSQLVNQELATQTEQVKGQLAQADGLIQLAEKLFGLDASEANLAALREQEDQTAYLVAKDQLAERRKAIDAVKTQAAMLFQAAAQQINAPMSDDEKQSLIAEEQTKLLERIPEWKDEETHQKEASELVAYLTDSYAYTQEQIGDAIDHRLFDMARKAMLYDRQQANVQAAKKKVVTIPKVMKPGTKASESEGPKDAAEILYGKK